MTCEKCGASDIYCRWHGKVDHHSRRYARCHPYGDDWGKPKEEHLHYTCRNCAYEWTVPLTPAALPVERTP